MSTPRTSRSFELVRQIKATLEASTWPTHPVTGRIPRVGFASVQAETGAELVVVTTIEPDSTSEWVTMPAGRDETILVEIWIGSNVERKTEDDVLDRLEVLADVAQDALRDSETGQPARLLGDADLLLGQVSNVTFSIYPASNGFVGECTLRAQWQARL